MGYSPAGKLTTKTCDVSPVQDMGGQRHYSTVNYIAGL